MDIKPDEIYQLAIEQYNLIQQYINKTPIIRSQLSENLFIKCENLQFTGSFKIRGASSKLTKLNAEGAKKIVTSSTGNHAFAVLTMATIFNMDIEVFVPESITYRKEANLLEYNIKLQKIAGDAENAEIEGRRYAESQNSEFVSPYNDKYVIAGQASIALELQDQLDLKEISRIYVPVGGGGLISGIGSVLKTEFPHIEIIGCQPTNSAAMYESIQAGKIIEIEHKPTISDASAGGLEKDAITFNLAKSVVDRYIRVSEEEIKDAMRMAYKFHNSIVEGSAGVTLASFLKERNDGKKSIVVWSGANIDVHKWVSVIENK